MKRAGTIVFFATLVVWALLNFPQADVIPGATPAVQARMDLEASFGAQIGKEMIRST